ncbi:MAG: phosphate transporter substrate-binding protein [Phenylobacterium sp.]|nr:phosphate transporter substrate-binding protein [Phenylobacterium sp.]
MRRLVALALTLSLAAGPAVGRDRLSGRIACAGGDTMAPLMQRWGEAFHARHPAVTVGIDPQARLAADGFRALIAGQADCVTFVREPFPSEEAAFRARFGHPPLLVPVAGGSFATRGGTHAIAVYVNAANPIAGLTLAQLDAAFSAAPRRGAPKPALTWGELGLAGTWAGRPVRLYGMLAHRASGDPPGVVNFVQRRVLLGAPFRADVAEQVDRPGEQALATIVRKVAEDPGGLGYSGFGYAARGARAVPIAESDHDPYVAGSPQTVADGRYPLSRRIYILVDRAPGQPLPAPLNAFLRYALSPAGQAAIAADAEGFLPLTAAEAAAARRSLQ